MRSRIKAAAAAAAVVAALLAGSISPATAAEVAPSGDVAATAEGGDVGARCGSGWRYVSTSRGGDVHYRVGPTQSNYNGTSSPANLHFTSSVSGTVQVGVSGSTNVGASVKLASISATYGINAQASLTANVGVTFDIVVPAFKTGNGNFGVWRASVTGKENYYLSNCTVADTKSTSVMAPYRVGWNTWIS